MDNPVQLEEITQDHSGRIILRCKKCRQRLILLELEEDWLSEERIEFECKKCGKRLTLGRARSCEEEHKADGEVRNLIPSLHNPGS